MYPISTELKAHRAAAAAIDLGNALNAMGFDVAAFADQIVEVEHRTIQQSIFRAMLSTIERWAIAGNQGHYDARNEATVTACQAIVAALDPDLHLPTI